MRTAVWHVRYGAVAVVYGHLYTSHGRCGATGRFEQVSVGFPPEWRGRGETLVSPRRVLPELR
jgi:hypothetical protein